MKKIITPRKEPRQHAPLNPPKPQTHGISGNEQIGRTGRGLRITLTESWKRLLEHRGLTSAGAAADILFFFLFSWLATWAVRTLQGPLELIYSIAGDNISKLATDLNNPDAIQGILADQERFLAAYHSVLQTVAIFIGAVFILWLIMQWISWGIAHRIAGTPYPAKEFAKKYIKRFTLLTTGGGISIVGILFLSSRAAAWININRTGETAQMLTSTIVGLLLFITLYFLFSGYASDPAGRLGATWDTAITGWRRMISAYLITLAIAFSTSIILEKILSASLIIGGTDLAPYLGLAFGLLIAAPAYTYNRTLLIISARQS